MGLIRRGSFLLQLHSRGLGDVVFRSDETDNQRDLAEEESFGEGLRTGERQ